MCGGRCEWARELEREWELEPEWARVCEAERASPFAVTVDVALFPDAAEVVEKVEMVVAVVAVEAAETLVIAEAYELALVERDMGGAVGRGGCGCGCDCDCCCAGGCCG